MNGGHVRLAFHQEPEHLNPYLAVHGAGAEISTMLMGSGFVDFRADGTSWPVLARELPTERNGGLSADHRTVTYRLREGLRWSDGAPVTSEDARFTWQAVTGQACSAGGSLGQDQVEAVDCPDPLTVRVRLRSAFAPYRVLFPALLPRHAAAGARDMRSWPFNHRPVGAGAFRFDHWERGRCLRLRLNAHHRLRPDLPYLDGIAVHFVPSVEAAIEMLAEGRADGTGRVTEDHLPALRSIPHARILRGPGPSAERLVFNLAHPILGDRRVREAIELAIDKRGLVDRLLHGEARAGTGELHAGQFQCDGESSEFDPRRAERLLVEAGWRRGAEGVMTGQSGPAPAGRRLRLELHTIEGSALRRRTAELLAEGLRAIGVEVVPVFAPARVLFDTSPTGRYRRGRFDMILWSFASEWDPHTALNDFFGSWSIPGPANGFTGWNYSRWASRRADACIAAGRSTADVVLRRRAYRELVREVARERPLVYLYSRDVIYAVHEALCGPRYHMWDYLGWNCARWHWRRRDACGSS
jgi:peptide/nickel transport system substrate-binding protein